MYDLNFKPKFRLIKKDKILEALQMPFKIDNYHFVFFSKNCNIRWKKNIFFVVVANVCFLKSVEQLHGSLLLWAQGMCPT